ncbi:hypothetical protein IAU60_006515 [Kwoniella sp. DSM 27419]
MSAGPQTSTAVPDGLPRYNTGDTVISTPDESPLPLSRDRTYVNISDSLNAHKEGKEISPASSPRKDSASLGPVNDNGPAANQDQLRRQTTLTTVDGAEVKLSQREKWFLLLIFSVAQYLDVASVSGMFIFTDAILTDLDIVYESSSWIITAYAVTFASFLLFWGRVSDLYSAKPVFTWGFIGLGVTTLIISFMTDKYAFFIIRAISGIAGAATIPAAFRLILAIFEPSELSMALTLFGLSGAIANVTGLIIAGLFGFVTAGGQMAAWRWFFRMFTIICIPFGVAALYLIPKTKGDKCDAIDDRKEKLKRLDLIGALTMLVAIVLLILGLTLGASYGWKTAKFLVPFLLCWPLFAGFFVWEARLPEGYALIPPSFWKIPNMTLLMVFALGIYPWWGVNQLAFVERFLVVDHDSPIIAAVRMLPQGIAALIVALFFPPLLQRLGSARWPLAAGMVIGAVAYILFIFSQHGSHAYWRFLFPSFILGSGAMMASFLGTNITVMTSVPPSMSGVAGAMLQVALQVGSVVGLSVQAGLLTLKPGSFENFANVQASYWFQFGWAVINVFIILLFFRNKAAEGSAAAAKLEGKEGPDVIMHV